MRTAWTRYRTSTSHAGSGYEPVQTSVASSDFCHESRSERVREIVDATDASARIFALADANALAVHVPPAGISDFASLPAVPWPRPTMTSTYDTPSAAAVRRTSASMS